MLDKNMVGSATQSVGLRPAASASHGKISEIHSSGPIADLSIQNLWGMQPSVF